MSKLKIFQEFDEAVKVALEKQRRMLAKKAFTPGIDYIPPSGKVVGEAEVSNAARVAAEAWFTEGHWVKDFEKAVAMFVGVRHALMCNSGSSANLLAIAALTSPLYENPLLPGDEVITAAAGFPTTVNPLLQNYITPVFVDVELDTLVPSFEMIVQAINAKTKGIILAHTLGNPFPAAKLAQVCRERGLFLIEDNCDALGSTHMKKKTGTFGLMATQSFYPAHHITTGEGGMVLTGSSVMQKLLLSFRDWGRACWCAPGAENTCGERYDYDWEHLPDGYDHKYVYSQVGYNLKSTDFQGAIGLAQMERLPGFVAARRVNFDTILAHLKDLEHIFILPRATANSDPSWFGFPLTIREDAPFSREELLRFLNNRKIGTRLLFGGNLLAQPAYVRHYLSRTMQQSAFPLPNTDIVMRQTFWVGVWPGLTPPMLEWITESIHDFVKEKAA